MGAESSGKERRFREKRYATVLARCLIAGTIALAPLLDAYANNSKPAVHRIRSVTLKDIGFMNSVALPDTSPPNSVVARTFDAGRGMLSNIVINDTETVVGFSGVSTNAAFSGQAQLKVLQASLEARKAGNMDFFHALLGNSYEASLQETGGKWGFSFSENGVKLNYEGIDSVELALGRNSPASVIECMSSGWTDIKHSNCSGYSWMSAAFRLSDNASNAPKGYLAFGFTSSGEKSVRVAGTMVRLPGGWVVSGRRHLLSSKCCEGFAPSVFAEIKEESSGKTAELLLIGSSAFGKPGSAKVRIFISKDGMIEEYK